MVFTIFPAEDTIEENKRQDIPKSKWPGDSLAIFSLESQELKKIPELTSVKLPVKWGGWIAYQTGSSEDKTHTLHIHQVATGEEDTLAAVHAFEFAEMGMGLVAATADKDSIQEAGVHYFDCQEKSWSLLQEEKGKYSQLSISKSGDWVAYLVDRDSTKALVRPYELMLWEKGEKQAVKVGDDDSDAVPTGYLLSPDFTPTFSENEERMLIGLRSYPVVEDTSMLEEEQVQVEVWTYKDPLLYTQQEIQAKNERKRSYKALLDLTSKRITPLADRTMPKLDWGDEGKAQWAIGVVEEPYQQEISWEGASRKDLYRVNLGTGERTLLANGIGGSPQLSPSGKFAFWYDRPDSSWKAIELSNSREISLSQAIPTPMYDELNDRPMHPYPNGMAGWLEGDTHVLLYDRYDLWKVSLSNPSEVVNLTEGRDEYKSYRYIRLDPDLRFIPANSTILLHITHQHTLLNKDMRG